MLLMTGLVGVAVPLYSRQADAPIMIGGTPTAMDEIATQD